MNTALLEMLKSTRLFTGLSEGEAVAALRLAGAYEKAYAKHTVIWEQGESVEDIAILTGGSLLYQKYHTDGSIQLVRSFAAPDVVGLETVASHKCTSPLNALMSTAGRIFWIPYRPLVYGEGISPNVRWTFLENILAHIADDNIRHMKKSHVLSRHSTKERVLEFLCILRDKYKSATFDIGMNQHEFAAYLCVDRSTLSDTLSKMQKDGLIEYRKTVYTLNIPSIRQ
jgi:CRP-like cAMP-binding protein